MYYLFRILPNFSDLFTVKAAYIQFLHNVLVCFSVMTFNNLMSSSEDRRIMLSRKYRKLGPRERKHIIAGLSQRNKFAFL